MGYRGGVLISARTLSHRKQGWSIRYKGVTISVIPVGGGFRRGRYYLGIRCTFVCKFVPGGTPIDNGSIIPCMGYISRTLLPKYRSTLPMAMPQTVQPVYLGMPPLPIGTGQKFPAIPKEDKVATTTISGVGVGSVDISSKQVGTAHRRKANTKLPVGSGQQSSQIAPSNRTKGKKGQKIKVKRLLPKRVNGRFVKSK